MLYLISYILNLIFCIFYLFPELNKRLTAVGAAMIDSSVYNGFWIGLNDVGLAQGSWQWASGATDTVQDSDSVWATNQPNHNTNQDCVKIKISGAGWDDVKCTNPHPYVCQTLL